VEGLAGSNVHVVATLPAQDPSMIPAARNAHVMGFVPHGPILNRAACVVTHGGMGATQKALAHGVPVCVVPFGRDQLEVARRAQVAGAGTRLPARKLTPERLRDKVVEAMRCTPGARRVQAAFAAAGGAVAAADAMEQRLLGGRTAARQPTTDAAVR
jgi:UDP:flavonoid glycosyltransferase YjiC (YdhE family)